MIYEEKSIDIIGLIKELWAPLLVAVSAYLTSRLTLVIKKVELVAQAGLRARELYFNSYEEDLKELNKNTYETLSKLAKFSNTVKTFTSNQEKIDASKQILEHLKSEYEKSKYFYEDLFEKVQKDLPSMKFIERIKVIKETMDKDISMINSDQYEKMLYDYSHAYSLLLNIELELKENKRDKLFARYLE